MVAHAFNTAGKPKSYGMVAEKVQERPRTKQLRKSSSFAVKSGALHEPGISLIGFSPSSFALIPFATTSPGDPSPPPPLSSTFCLLLPSYRLMRYPLHFVCSTQASHRKRLNLSEAFGTLSGWVHPRSVQASGEVREGCCGRVGC
ncbi:uncharacterized protein [Physcomitrium patens]|uniref:uncharacterized protein n=1 Tax=Physcomitrium patens TaxID=3218 RepID=UPI003CCCEC00